MHSERKRQFLSPSCLTVIFFYTVNDLHICVFKKRINEKLANFLFMINSIFSIFKICKFYDQFITIYLRLTAWGCFLSPSFWGNPLPFFAFSVSSNYFSKLQILFLFKPMSFWKTHAISKQAVYKYHKVNIAKTKLFLLYPSNC